MRRWGSLLSAIALILAAAGFAFAVERAGNRADAACGGVTLYMETPLSEGEVQTLIEQKNVQEDAVPFTVWGELANQRITDPDLSRSVKADVLILHGDCGLILPQTAALSSGDEHGCLIGAKTAWDLFGSTDVSGDEIRIGAEIRSIRGIVPGPGEGVVLTGSLKGVTEGVENGKTCCYDRITLLSEKEADGDVFLMQNGLDGEVLRFDYLRGFQWLFELVPGKWSDFSGWKENYNNKKQDVDLMLRVRKHGVEIFYEKQCMALAWNRTMEIFCVLAAVFCLGSFFGYFPGDNHVVQWISSFQTKKGETHEIPQFRKYRLKGKRNRHRL